MNLQVVDAERPASRSGVSTHMLTLPGRSDTAAIWAIGIAGLTYVVLAIVFIGGLLATRFSTSTLLSLIGIGEDPNVVVFTLILLGFAIVAFAFVFALQDCREVRAEEEDICWVVSKGREGVQLVLAPVDRRQKMWDDNMRTVDLAGHPVETLLDDRVRRVMAARQQLTLGSVSVEELRVIAEQRSARLGAFQRYAVSLLLLLAVLGTFAGVKNALPRLIEALSSASALTTGLGTLTSPLNAVADAFGGNALALIGAIAVGVIAQGFVVARRNLLERLELVSAEYVYADELSVSGAPLESAVHTMTAATREFAGASSRLIGIEDGLDRLGENFQSAFKSLEQKLTEALQGQEVALYDRTALAIEELQTKVAQLVVAVDANARVYNGLVDSIAERATESREAIRELGDTGTTIRQSLNKLDAVSAASSAAALNVEQAAKALETAATNQATQLGTLQNAATAINTSVETMQGTLNELPSTMATVLATHEQQLARIVQTVDEVLKRQPAGPQKETKPTLHLTPLVDALDRNGRSLRFHTFVLVALLALAVGTVIVSLL